uniref:4a-hydroxytetrahydrobiopterin dehydratase n=1 Tax=Corethron hystrix TaxID=216773 RepID=A0A7S1BA70_9STRA|mmetsp:Transcript_19144/g.43590  ORF Transcript_19144/g.43590 Transcript_19144/m.43590 type:complete len:147 (+) Transcript_19144:100-540(+)
MSAACGRICSRFGNSIKERALTKLDTISSSFSSLSGAERERAIQSLVNKSENFPFRPWHQEEGRDALLKTFEFADFSQAFSFMTRAALLAEKMDHHPEWSNVYNLVEVTLTTHSLGGISKKDVKMANLLDEYANDILPLKGSNVLK